MTPTSILCSGLFLMVTTLEIRDDPPKPEKPSASGPLAEARALTEGEHWAEAEAKFRAYVESNPKSPQAPEARFWAGFCLVKQGEHERAADMLKPFLGEMAADKWADDALLKLGEAYHELDREQDAVDCWKRQLEKYPESIWRAEVFSNVIESLFNRGGDYSECFSFCDRLLKENGDRDSTREARYVGAFCLNALRRPDEAIAWAEHKFDPASPLEEAWRRLLEAHRDMLAGRLEPAQITIDALATDFPDLEPADRDDLLVRTCRVLREVGQTTRARDLLLRELRLISGRGEDQAGSLLEELEKTAGKEHRDAFLEDLSKLAGDSTTPLVIRVAARRVQAQALCDDEQAEQAESLLRQALKVESTEYGKAQLGVTLAEVLADDREDRPAAVRLLDDLVPGLKRRDLIHRVKAAAEAYRKD